MGTHVLKLSDKAHSLPTPHETPNHHAMPHLGLGQMDLLDAVVVAVDVVVLRCKHVDDGVVLEVPNRARVEIVHFLHSKTTDEGTNNAGNPYNSRECLTCV
jgi:hypothetical protein